MAWLTVQEGLPHTWVRPALRTLEAVGAEARAEDGRLEVRDTPEARWALATAEEFLEANRTIWGLAAELDKPVTPYKPLERYVLVAALLRSGNGDEPDAWARICHEVIWAQGLPNANHRSTVLWLQSRVAPPGSVIHHAETLEDEMDAYLHDSKALIHEREHRPDQERLKREHAERTRRFIQDWLAHMERPGPGQSR